MPASPPSPITKFRVSFIFPSMAGRPARILVLPVRRDNYAPRIRPGKPVCQQGRFRRSRWPSRGRSAGLYSHAQGGKVGTPFPVDRATYDRNITVLTDAVRKARLGENDRVRGITTAVEAGTVLNQAAVAPGQSIKCSMLAWGCRI